MPNAPTMLKKFKFDARFVKIDRAGKYFSGFKVLLLYKGIPVGMFQEPVMLQERQNLYMLHPEPAST